MHVELIEDTTVHMAPGMYSWCALLTFAFPAAMSGTDLINSVLAHPRYHHDCASPWTGIPGSRHGPYRMDSLKVDGFQRCSHADAMATLWSWPATNLNPWVSSSLLLSRELIMAWASPILSTADEIYRLSLPRKGNEHPDGWVVGLNGFHEFIAVCRNRGVATVIIATDD